MTPLKLESSQGRRLISHWHSTMLKYWKIISTEGKVKLEKMTDKNDNDKIITPESHLKLVRSVWGPVEAEVIKSFLESQGIACILKGLVVQSIHTFSVNGLGETKIFVDEADYKLAKKLIESRLQEDF